jgi:hypothetical protein
MSVESTNIDDVLDSFSAYLSSLYPKNVERFDSTRHSNHEAAIAEAITFAMLQTMGLQPNVIDQVGTDGGVDFICRSWRGRRFNRLAENQFVVEATSLSPDAVSTRSHIANAVPEEIIGSAFGLVTQNILNKAKAKATQLKGYSMPRVLTIVSSHFGASMLFNEATAKLALTDHKKSVFTKPGPDATIIACRQSISAILLVAAYGNHMEVWGILHPEPAYRLNVEFLPDIPFVRIVPWPIVNGSIATDWVIGSPSGHNVHLFPVRLP